MNNIALMIIDMQNDYFPAGKFSLPKIEMVAKNCKEILNIARQISLPIFHIKHEFKSAAASFFVANSVGAEIHNIVQPLEGEQVILKNYPNAFQKTPLKTVIDQHKCDTIIIVGAMVQMCIDATVRAGADFGYKIILVEDAVAAQHVHFNNVDVDENAVHAAFLEALSIGYAKIVKTKNLIDELKK